MGRGQGWWRVARNGGRGAGEQDVALVLSCFLLSLKIGSLMAFPSLTKEVPRREPFSSLASGLLAAVVQDCQRHAPLLGSKGRILEGYHSMKKVPGGFLRSQLQVGTN